MYEQITRATYAIEASLPTLWTQEWHSAIVQQAHVHRDLAADFGTQVHAGIQARWLGEVFLTTDIRVMQCVEGFFKWYKQQRDIILGEPEHTFVNTEWGYAGTVDSLNGWYRAEPANFDFKTREPDSLTNLYDPEEPLQHAGYAMGTSTIDNLRISLHISREDGSCWTHLWSDNDRYNAMWVCLLGLWQLKSKYYPGQHEWAGIVQQVVEGAV